MKQTQSTPAGLLPWLLMGLVWTCMVVPLNVAPFDLDEAVYRRMAEEMKATGLSWGPQVDGITYNHKPPLYMMVLALVSMLIDGPTAHISAATCRTVSLVFTLLTQATLALAWQAHVRRRLVRPGQRRKQLGAPHEMNFSDAALPRAGAMLDSVEKSFVAHPLFPVILLSTGFLPLLGSGAILLDPMLTFFLTLALVGLDALLRRDAPSPNLQTSVPQTSLVALPKILLCVGIAGAIIVKGLVGLVLPGAALVFAVVLWCVSQSILTGRTGLKPQNFRAIFSCVWACVPAFILGSALGLGFYVFLYFQGQQEFVSEFFLVHHFARGANAMEGHGGSLLYHPLVVWVGGLQLSGILSLILVRARLSVGHWRGVVNLALLPLGWILGIVTFFSLVATKLPNYVWPVWPALALAVAHLWFSLVEDASVHEVQGLATPQLTTPQLNSALPQSTKYSWSTLVTFPAVATPFVLGMAFLVLAPGFAILRDKIPADAHLEAFLKPGEQLPFAVVGGLVFTATCFLASAALQWALWHKIARYPVDGGRQRVNGFGARKLTPVWIIFGQVVANALACVAIYATLVPYAAIKVTEPAERMARRANELLQAKEQFTTIDFFSPTVSSHFSGRLEQFTGPNEEVFADETRRLVLTPVWNEELCQKHKAQVVHRDGHLILCRKE